MVLHFYFSSSNTYIEWEKKKKRILNRELSYSNESETQIVILYGLQDQQKHLSSQHVRNPKKQIG